MAAPPTERWGLAAARPPKGGARSLQPRRTPDPRLQDWERTQLPPLPLSPQVSPEAPPAKAQWGFPTSRPPPTRLLCQAPGTVS